MTKIAVNPTSTTRPFTVDVNVTEAPGGSMLKVYLDGSKKGEARAQRAGELATALAITSSYPLGNRTVEVRNSAGTVLASTTLAVLLAPPVEPPVEPPLPPVTGAIYGFAAGATGGTGTPDVRVTTAAQLIAALAMSNRNVTVAPGTYHLTAPAYIRGDNLTVTGDAVAPGVTVTGYPIYGEGATNIILRNLRHRGGLNIGEAGDGIVFARGCTLIALINLSVSKYSDEGFDSWTDNRDITWQDFIVGPAVSAVHNFGHLIGDHSHRLSIFRGLYHDTQYRNPAVGWDDGTDALTPEPITADVGNIIVWNYGAASGWGSGTTVYHGGKGNVRNSLYKGAPGADDAIEVGSNAQIYQSGNVSRDGKSIAASRPTPFPVPASAVLPLVSQVELIASIKANAGCRPLDAEDTAALAVLT